MNRKSNPLFVIALLLAILTTGCGGGGGGGATAGGAPAPAVPGQITGTVMAPPLVNLGVNRQASNNVRTASANGLVIKAGVLVSLYLVDDNGNPSGDVLATSLTDANGQFSFMLPAGVSLGPNLMVSVGTGNSRIRALAGGASLTVTPLSEKVVQDLVADAKPLSIFTTTEISVKTQQAQAAAAALDFSAATTISQALSLFEEVEEGPGVVPTRLLVQIDPDTLATADSTTGTKTATVRAVALGEGNVSVGLPNTPVSFSFAAVTTAMLGAPVYKNGGWEATLNAPTTEGALTVLATTATGLTGSAVVQVVESLDPQGQAGGDPATPVALLVQATPQALAPFGSTGTGVVTQALIKVTVLNGANINITSGETVVSFVADKGVLSGIRFAGSTWDAVFTAPSSAGTATITATLENGISAKVLVPIAANVTKPAGVTLQTGLAVLAPSGTANVATSTVVTARVVNDLGEPTGTANDPVTFLASQKGLDITAGSIGNVTFVETGKWQATFNAPITTGSVLIKAVTSNNLSSSIEVLVDSAVNQSNVPDRIQVTIAKRAIGKFNGMAGPSTTDVEVTIFNSSEVPATVNGVNFEITDSVNGKNTDAWITSPQSLGNGTWKTILTAPSVSGSVTVRATTANGISGQASVRVSGRAYSWDVLKFRPTDPEITEVFLPYSGSARVVVALYDEEGFPVASDMTVDPRVFFFTTYEQSKASFFSPEDGTTQSSGALNNFSLVGIDIQRPDKSERMVWLALKDFAGRDLIFKPTGEKGGKLELCVSCSALRMAGRTQ